MTHLSQYLDPIFLIKTFGVLGIFGVVFAESGLFFGFFLPGDSLLFTAGLLASYGHFDFWLLLAGCAFYAVLGDSVGYAFGARAGPKLFTRDDSLFFRKAYIRKTEEFYAAYGKKTVILARFIPLVRTFAPILAGVGRMPYVIFLTYNVTGGILWTTLTLGAGYLLGRAVPGIDRYILPVVLGIIFLSFLPAAPHVASWRRSRARPAVPPQGDAAAKL